MLTKCIDDHGLKIVRRMTGGHTHADKQTAQSSKLTMSTLCSDELINDIGD